MGSTQDALILSVRINNACALAVSCRIEHGTHANAGAINKAFQFLGVSGHVGNRTRGHTRIHRGLGNRWRNNKDQARIEWFGDKILGAKRQLLTGISDSNFAVHRLMRHG